MIGYRDMTFCPFYQDCKNAPECPRPLTDEVRLAAAKWWGKGDDLPWSEIPITVYAERPGCHVGESGEATCE